MTRKEVEDIIKYVSDDIISLGHESGAIIRKKKPTELELKQKKAIIAKSDNLKDTEK